MTEPAGITGAATATATADPATATAAAPNVMPGASPVLGGTPAVGNQPAATVDWQAESEKWKAIARSNEARAKANADAAQQQQQQQELLAKVAQALGLQDAAPDPAKIAAQLEASQRAEKTRSVELAVLRAAARNGADGDALLDSRSFLNRIKDLDPGNMDGIKAAIEAAVAESPTKFKLAGTTTNTAQQSDQQQPATQQASTASDFNSGPGGARQWTAADVERASPAEVKKAMEAGLLRAYLAS